VPGAAERRAYPECGELCPGYDHLPRRWRHLDTCQHATILATLLPRVQCPEHGVRQVKLIYPTTPRRGRLDDDGAGCNAHAPAKLVTNEASTAPQSVTPSAMLISQPTRCGRPSVGACERTRRVVGAEALTTAAKPAGN
jgi:transposase IS204/IS1001/IS1096/IS1165 family protein